MSIFIVPDTLVLRFFLAWDQVPQWGEKAKNGVKWEKYQRAKQAQRWSEDRERAAPGPRLRYLKKNTSGTNNINFKGDARGTVQGIKTSTDV